MNFSQFISTSTDIFSFQPSTDAVKLLNRRKMALLEAPGSQVWVYVTACMWAFSARTWKGNPSCGLVVLSQGLLMLTLCCTTSPLEDVVMTSHKLKSEGVKDNWDNMFLFVVCVFCCPECHSWIFFSCTESNWTTSYLLSGGNVIFQPPISPSSTCFTNSHIANLVKTSCLSSSLVFRLVWPLNLNQEISGADLANSWKKFMPIKYLFSVLSYTQLLYLLWWENQ